MIFHLVSRKKYSDRTSRFISLPVRIRALSLHHLSQIFLLTRTYPGTFFTSFVTYISTYPHVSGHFLHIVCHRYFYLPVRIRVLSSQHLSQVFILTCKYPGAIFTSFVTDISTYPYVSGCYLYCICHRYFYLPVHIRVLSLLHLSQIFLLAHTCPGAFFTAFVTDISTYPYVSGCYLHIICHRYFYLPIHIRALSSHHLSQIFLLTRTYPGAIFTSFVTDISTYPYVSRRYLHIICHRYFYLPVHIQALSSQHLSQIFLLTRTYPSIIFTAFVTDISTYPYVSGRYLHSICPRYFYLPVRIRALSSQHLSQIFLLTRTYPGAIFTAFVTDISTYPYVSGRYLNSITTPW